MNRNISPINTLITVRPMFDRDALVGRCGTPEDLAAHLKSETARFAEIIRKGNITMQ